MVCYRKLPLSWSIFRSLCTRESVSCWQALMVDFFTYSSSDSNNCWKLTRLIKAEREREFHVWEKEPKDYSGVYSFDVAVKQSLQLQKEKEWKRPFLLIDENNKSNYLHAIYSGERLTVSVFPLFPLWMTLTIKFNQC